MFWHSLPPEMNTARLMAGAGPGPMLEAAAGWAGLGNALEAQAAGLAQALFALQGLWAGAGSERAIAAFTPMVAWLNDAANKSQQRAAQASAQADAYLTALAATPSLIDIVVNHVTHAVLLATNFLGINLMPIGANETDYFVRMWNEAAAAMDIYQAETQANTVFEPLLPLQPILQPEVGAVLNKGVGVVLSEAAAQRLTDFVPSWAAFSDEQAMQLLSQLEQLGPLTGPMQSLMQPIQQLTSLVGQTGGTAGSDTAGSEFGAATAGGSSSTLAGKELGQLGLLGASPLSNHPLAGGSGPSLGPGLIHAGALPGAAGSEARTALVSELIERPAETAPPATPGAGPGLSTGGGAAPRTLPAGGEESEADAGSGLVTAALVADHSDEGQIVGFDDGDDW